VTPYSAVPLERFQGYGRAALVAGLPAFAAGFDVVERAPGGLLDRVPAD
jgi:hypothetical protein